MELQAGHRSSQNSLNAPIRINISGQILKTI